MFKLGDFLLELGWIHALVPEGFCVLMHGLELSLKVLVGLQSIPHIFIMHELVGDFQRNEESSCVSFALQVNKTGDEPVQDVVESSLFTVDDITHKVRVEVAWVSKDFEEATDALFCLFLSFLLHVDINVRLVEV